MKRLLTGMLICLAAATSGSAFGIDMRVGQFNGNWCGVDAVFFVESQEQDTDLFHGFLYLVPTGDYDAIVIEQFEDDSLEIIRYLPGDDDDRTQSVETFPPEYHNFEGMLQYRFLSRESHGDGCEGARSYLLLPPV